MSDRTVGAPRKKPLGVERLERLSVEVYPDDKPVVDEMRRLAIREGIAYRGWLVRAIRAELARVRRQHPEWDGEHDGRGGAPVRATPAGAARGLRPPRPGGTDLPAPSSSGCCPRSCSTTGARERPDVGCGPRQGPDLLRLLLKNLGVRGAVRLAPREAWPAALRETAPGEPPTRRKAGVDVSTTKAPSRTRDLDEADGLTEEEFLALPGPAEGGKLELVRGRVVAVPPASAPHQTVAYAIARAWEDAAGPLRDPRALAGPRARGLVVVDVLGRTAPEETRPRRRHPAGPGRGLLRRGRYAGPVRVGSLPVAPTLAVELLSPEDAWEAMGAKAGEYLRSARSVVWVIDLYPDAPSRGGAPGVPPPGVWTRRYRALPTGVPGAADAAGAAGVETVDLPGEGPDAVLDARPYLDSVLPLPAIYATAGLEGE